MCLLFACFAAVLGNITRKQQEKCRGGKGRALPGNCENMKMRQIGALLLAVLMISCCTACQQPGAEQPPATTVPAPVGFVPPAVPTRETPAGVVMLLLKSTQELNVAQMMDCLSDTDGVDSDIPLVKMDELETMGLGFIRTHLARIEWEVTDEDISGDTAMVTVTIQAPDLSPVITQITGAATKYVTQQVLGGKTVDLPGFLAQYAKENIKPEEMKTKKLTAQVAALRQTDGTWLVDGDMDNNFDMMNALTGGAGETLKKVMDMGGSLLG